MILGGGGADGLGGRVLLAFQDREDAVDIDICN